MKLFYNLGIHLYGALLSVVALFNHKAHLFVSGRKNWKNTLSQKFMHIHKRKVWIHVASVGEFEQSRVLIEKIKNQHPEVFILLTFFSPSGYELRKDYPFADFITYLPLDKKINAEDFVTIVKPDVAIFTKYEFWDNYFTELNNNDIPIISISSIFRENQIFFKKKDGFNAKTLKKVSSFFVQDEKSKHLLAELGITEVSVNGDTRFDRVNQIAQQSKDIPLVEKFVGGQPCLVCGSVWKADMEILIPLINSMEGKLKFVIAPHEIHAEEIENYRQQIKLPSSLFSEGEKPESEVLFIDNVGMLSSLYKYGSFAYVGGAFGKGLHNILEPAAFGLPVFFGNKKYHKFNEALSMLDNQTAFTVSTTEMLADHLSDLLQHKEKLNNLNQKVNAYVKSNVGASERIFNFIEKKYLTV